MTERVPPHNLEAEQSVLGALMLDSQAFDLIQDTVVAEDFYRSSHRTIFQTISDLQRKSESVDLLTVTHALKTKQLLEQVGGAPYLATLLESTLSASNIERYAVFVAETSLLRKLIKDSGETIEKAFSGDFEDVPSFLDEAESKIFSLSELKQSQSVVGSAEIVKTAIANIEELYHRKSDIVGIPSGFNELDKLLSGFQGGQLVILAARPAMGKTAFSLNLAQHAVLRHQKSVAYFSLEMSKESLMMRMLASEARINMGDLRIGRVNDQIWPRLIQAASTLSDAKFFVDESAGLSPFEIRAKCRRLKAQHGLDMILIDYLQLMSLKGRVENREREVAEISKTLKEISKEMNIPVVALAQLNRGVESRTDKRPMLSDLRESGSIEQDADIIMMLYRDEYYEKENSQYKGQAEVIVTKQRNGSTGTVRLAFKGQYGTFLNLAPASMDTGAPPPEAPPEEFKDESGEVSVQDLDNFAPGL
ncbi:MAG: replicative DNA helicase [Bdellovibrionales bacterium]